MALTTFLNKEATMDCIHLEAQKSVLKNQQTFRFALSDSKQNQQLVCKSNELQNAIS